MEQNENNKIETAREENAATTQSSHEEMQKKLKKQRIRQDHRQSHRRSHSRLRTLEDRLPLPGL